MNVFLKSNEVSLNAAGYLVAVVEGKEKPVNHPAFVAAQEKAEFTVRVSEAIKGKNFKVGEVADLKAIMAEVRNSLNTTKAVSYVDAPTAPSKTLTNQLADEAMAFVKFEDEKGKVAKINEAMQEFNAIAAIESVGDYFSEGLVRLNQTKLYTIDEVKSAVIAIQAIS